MPKSLVERRLIEVSNELKRLREDVHVANEQLTHFAEEAEDARLRALVSETAGADREHRDAERHASSMVKHRDELMAKILKLEQSQDDLLDRLTAES